MPKMTVKESIEIEASPKKVMEVLTDYRQWPEWSPWLITEPDAELNYNDSQGQVGASYSWKGELTGQGEMALVDATEEDLDMDLTFLKPFKSKAKVSFIVEKIGSHCKVTWTMTSKLPFFLFFMVKKMSAVIGMDYRRGLKMLKEYVEKGWVSSQIRIVGKEDIPVSRYIGVQDRSNLDTLGEHMPEHYKKIAAHLAENGIEPNGLPFSIYNSVDVLTNEVDFLSAIPISETVEVDSEKFVVGHLEAKPAVKVEHRGSYDHLGNAWASSIMYARANKIKVNKEFGGVEIYMNDPNETEPADLISEIYLTLR